MTSSKAPKPTAASPSQGVIAPVFEPLPHVNGRGVSTDYGLGAVLPVLKQKPDTWARVAEFAEKKPASNAAYNINKGKNRKFALYMRYVGEETTSE